MCACGMTCVCVCVTVACRYKDLKQYILERRDALGPPPSAPRTTSKPKGKELTAAELLGETEPAEAKPKKGFA